MNVVSFPGPSLTLDIDTGYFKKVAGHIMVHIPGVTLYVHHTCTLRVLHIENQHTLIVHTVNLTALLILPSSGKRMSLLMSLLLLAL